jgi:hypothetical protein
MEGTIEAKMERDKLKGIETWRVMGRKGLAVEEGACGDREQ